MSMRKITEARTALIKELSTCADAASMEHRELLPSFEGKWSSGYLGRIMAKAKRRIDNEERIQTAYFLHVLKQADPAHVFQHLEEQAQTG